MDRESLELLEDALRKTMLSTSGAELDAALTELGWAEMLTDMPEVAVPLVFRLLGETGSHASVLNDVVQQAADRELGATPELPYAGGGWVVWDYQDTTELHARWPAAAPSRRRRAASTCRCPQGTWLVAGRCVSRDAGPRAPTCVGPSPIRPTDRGVPGGPAPAGRDAGGHRRRRGDAEPVGRRQP